jgi:hypothetical protein
LVKNGEKQCTTLLQLAEGMKGVLLRFGSKNDLENFVTVVESIVSQIA